MRGLMSKPTGEIIEIPIKSNYKQGLSVIEYFMSTNGARKGQSDTALKTASSGYLTRRLVDVAQDVVVTMHDCKTLGYLEIADLKEAGDTVYPMGRRVFGRVLAADLKDPVTGVVINPQVQMVVMSRKARLLIVAPDGRELQQHALEYGSIIYVKDKQEVKEGTKLADWDAYNKVLMTEKAGTVVYLDLIKNVTIHERFDEATGKSRTIVMGTRGEQYQPAISIVDDKGEEVTQYFLPEGSYVNVTEKQR